MESGLYGTCTSRASFGSTAATEHGLHRFITAHSITPFINRVLATNIVVGSHRSTQRRLRNRPRIGKISTAVVNVMSSGCPEPTATIASWAGFDAHLTQALQSPAGFRGRTAYPLQERPQVFVVFTIVPAASTYIVIRH